MCSSNIVYYKKQQQKDTEEFIAGNHALKEADSEENFDAQYLSTQISSTWWLHDRAEQSSLFSSKLTNKKKEINIMLKEKKIRIKLYLRVEK